MVTGRRKSILSVYGKILAKQDMKISSIRDIFAFRVILEEEDPDLCYALLDHLGKHFVFDVTRYKDYVSVPKVNGYQSLHLGLMFDLRGKSFPIELQIRTRKMHEIAEHGIAAHHIYAKLKDAGRFIDIHPLSRPTLSDDMIYCVSPERDMILLRKNHSLRDFARVIHTALPNKIE
jgi:(p)ppGpp synthase/HD superfamily hydrolase